MLKKYGRNLVRSFYDASLYKEAITQTEGIGGRHILFVSCVVALFITVVLAFSFYAFNKYDLPYIAEQVPQIDITDSVVSVKVPEPVLITTRDKRFRVVIDTKATNMELFKKDAEIVVGKNMILFRQLEGFKTIPLKDVKKYTMNKAVVYEFFHKIYAFLFLAWPLLTLGQAISLLGQTFIVAILSYIVTAPMKEEYYFDIRMRLSALATTPSFIISKTTAMLTDTATQAPMTKTWFALLLSLLYFYVMLMLIRRLDTDERQPTLPIA